MKSPLLTSVLSLTVAASLAVGVLPARAAAANRTPTVRAMAGSAALLTAQQMAPASVLGLEGKDARASEELTVALRKAFKTRGLAGGDEATLVEMRLAMGCDNLEPACMAEGGEALGVDRLVYGTLTPKGKKSFDLQLQILDVATKEIVNETSQSVPADDLKPDVIDATALAIVNGMLGSEEDPEPVPTVGADPVGEDPVVEDPPVVEDKPRESKYWFGRDKDGPKWKRTGFFVSLAVAGAGAVTGAVAGSLTQFLYNERYKRFISDGLGDGRETPPDEVRAAAAADPATKADVEIVCKWATPESGTTSADPNLGEACRDGKRSVIIANTGWAVMGAGLLGTVIFGTLLLVHKKKPGQDSISKRQLRLSALPDGRGGGSVGASFRF